MNVKQKSLMIVPAIVVMLILGIGLQKDSTRSYP